MRVEQRGCLPVSCPAGVHTHTYKTHPPGLIRSLLPFPANQRVGRIVWLWSIFPVMRSMTTSASSALWCVESHCRFKLIWHRMQNGCSTDLLTNTNSAMLSDLNLATMQVKIHCKCLLYLVFLRKLQHFLCFSWLVIHWVKAVLHLTDLMCACV